MDTFEFLKSKGKPALIDAEYQSCIEEWKQWYKGSVDNFHTYKENIGGVQKSCERANFDGAKLICEAYANLLLNEKVKFTVAENDKLQRELNDTLKQVNFYERANKLIELTFAMGTGAFVEYVGADKQPKLKYVRAEMIYPLSCENGNITECAFASNIKIKGNQYTYIEAHTKDNKGLYIVDNFVLKDKGQGEFAEITDDLGILPQWKTGSNKPYFQIIKPNIVNTTDFDSPMGISIFANAIDNLKALDIVFDSYTNEFILGIKRVYVSDNAFKSRLIKNADGTTSTQKIVDIDTRIIRAMPFDNDFMKQIDFNLRVTEHQTAMQDQLNYLSAKCGLGTQQFKFESGGAATATEIISTNSEKYKSMVKHELGLEKPLQDMAEKLLELKGYKNSEISIAFDDSIIEDTKAIKDQVGKEVMDGTRSVYSYLTSSEGRNLSDEEATAELDRIKDDKTSTFTGIGGE